MRYKLNIQNFVDSVPDMTTPRYVTWFFKEKLTFTKDIDFYIDFYLKGQNVLYNRFYTVSGTPDGYILYYNESSGYMDVYNDTEQWLNEDSRIIRVDSNTLNSQDYISFATWAKANGGVLLEKGTYKWVDTLTFVGTVDVLATFNFISKNTNYDMLDVHSTKGGSMYYGIDTVYVSDWLDTDYKTITTSTDQYVDYDFYNYAITGGRLVKQETPEPTTGTVKFGTSAPTKYYLGNKAVDRIYMGTVLLYKKAVVYTITANLANCTANSDNPITIEENGGAILYYTANTGYELPDGVELTNVGSYNWDKATGKLVIARPSGNVTIKIVAKQTMAQLATPQNVSVENTTLSFDEVENAEEYEVFVDNVSIGTYSKPSYKLTSDSIAPHNIEVNGTALTSLPYTLQSGDIIVANLMGMEDSALTVNGVKQTSNNQIFTLTNTNIAIELSDGSFNDPKVTINYE